MRRISLPAAALVIAAALCGCGAVQRLFATPGSTAADTLTPTAAEHTTPPNPGSQEILDAFREIAFTSEYGSTSDGIRKWTVPVKAAVHGDPTVEDKAALGRAIDGLNAVDGFPGIGLDEGSHNMDIWFVPLGKMADVVPDYQVGNWGFFTTYFDSSGITSATVAIATDVTTQQARNHLIFEEVLQSTGLMQDSNRYADSIFFGPWTTVQQPTKLDWELLRLLYLPQIKQGMAVKEAMAILKEKVGSPKGN